MTTIPTPLRRFVNQRYEPTGQAPAGISPQGAGNEPKEIQRADNRCEYCKISQTGQVATFHIDHIVPVVAGGATISENLALACVSCSLRKGARQTLEDLETGEFVSIYNPRQQIWKEHFDWSGVEVVGVTATGRATLETLDLNRPAMLVIRAEEELLGRHPPL